MPWWFNDVYVLKMAIFTSSDTAYKFVEFEDPYRSLEFATELWHLV